MPTKPLQVIMPLAGKGGRFIEKGYTFPKPLIEIEQKSMIELVIQNLAVPEPARFSFICRKDHVTTFYLDQVLQLLVPNSSVLAIEHETAGALCSVLLMIEIIDPEGELLIANGDQYVSSSIQPFYEKCRQSGTDGCILTFSSTHPRWSFARTDKDGVVTSVSEKRPISRQATAGLYYFRRAADFLKGAEHLILKGLRTSGQFFVCPVYNELILAGKRITTHHLPDGAMHSLGTPEDVELFLRNTR